MTGPPIRGAAGAVRARRALLLAGLAALGTTVLSDSRAEATVAGPPVAEAFRPVQAHPVRDHRVVAAPAAGAFRSVRDYPVVAPPVRLRIPAAGVDSPLPPLRRAADRTVEVPADFAVAGWFAGGPRPGQAGPAVILGHVDSAGGPGVFYRLAGLAPGAQVAVLRADGSTVGFRVTEVARVPKTGFPTAQVYGPSLAPTLRLITCGGRFDRVRGSYQDNVIVYADLADEG